MNIVKNVGLSKMDLLNIRNNEIMLSDLGDCTFVLTGAALLDDVDINTGAVKSSFALKTENGEIVTGIASSVYSTVDMILNVLTSKEIQSGVEVRLLTSESGQGRTFIKMEIIQYGRSIDRSIVTGLVGRGVEESGGVS